MESSNRIGEMVLLDDEPSDREAGAGIPVVILSGTGSRDEYIVACFATEGDHDGTGDHSIALGPEDLVNGTLSGGSVLRIDRVRTVANTAIRRAGVDRLRGPKIEEMLRRWAGMQTRAFHAAVHQPEREAPFVPGQSRIRYGGRVYDQREMVNLVDSSLDFWLTTGRYAARFETGLAAFLGIRHCALVNSGSSANLLSFMALTSPRLAERRILPGDEVITVAAGFPTTVAPIIQYGAAPVFVDVELPTYNIDCDRLEEALSPRTRAVMLAHTLGNPFDLARVKAFCDRHALWLIEDNCDALGSRYFLNGAWRYTGTCGDFGTSSFYPPHHITMGEGGAVYTDQPLLKRLVESFRDWGRDCWCASGCDNTCKKRFGQQFGELPHGYDHKYVYSHFGYNMKVTEMQAAIGCAQLEKLPEFIAARKRNWRQLRAGVAELEEWFVLPEPTPHADPSWFGFLLTVREGVGWTRDRLVAALERQGIQTRSLFAGNLVLHPCFDEMRSLGRGYRVVGELAVTNRILRDTFWLGVYPGMKPGMIDFMVERLRELVRSAPAGSAS